MDEGATVHTERGVCHSCSQPTHRAVAPGWVEGGWAGWPYLVCIGKEEDGDSGLQEEHQQQHHEELGIGGQSSAARPGPQPHLPWNRPALPSHWTSAHRPQAGEWTRVLCAWDPVVGRQAGRCLRGRGASDGSGPWSQPVGQPGGHCQHRQDLGGGTATCDCPHPAWPAPRLSATEAPPWPGPRHPGPS